jgi:hypothetical protein
VILQVSVHAKKKHVSATQVGVVPPVAVLRFQSLSEGALVSAISLSLVPTVVFLMKHHSNVLVAESPRM